MDGKYALSLEPVYIKNLFVFYSFPLNVLFEVYHFWKQMALLISIPLILFPS